MRLLSLTLATMLALGNSLALADERVVHSSPDAGSTIFEPVFRFDRLGRTIELAGSNSSTNDLDLDAKIEALRLGRDQISLRRSKWSMGIGGGMTIIGGVLVGVGAAKWLDCPPDEDSECDEQDGGGEFFAGAVVGVVGAVTLIAGGISYGVKKARRRDIDTKIRTLDDERKSLSDSVEIGYVNRHSSHMMTMRFEF